MIHRSVGKGGVNGTGDTLYVQMLLSDALVRQGQAPLAIDGICGPKTMNAILQFQKASALFADGRIDPDGPTIKALQNKHLQGLVSGSLVRPLPYLPTGIRKTVSSPSVEALQNTYLKILRSSLG